MQPLSQQIAGVLARPPWRAIFEEKRDYRLNGDGVDDPVVAAEPLVDQPGQPL